MHWSRPQYHFLFFLFFCGGGGGGGGCAVLALYLVQNFKLSRILNKTDFFCVCKSLALFFEH